ncbi:MAG: STAS/SEC14 domain-containing protein [Flavobacteriales bacterium]|nr:STAS/SEC14 domain-containing protein [Flavobacteriales bacterium]
MSYQKSIELPKAFLHLKDEGFVLLTFKDNVVIEVEDAKEIDKTVIDELIYNQPFVVLIDARDITSSLTHEARDFFTNDELILKIRKAQAIVVNNLHTKLIANFYMKFHKPINPVKVFSDYDKAENWLKKIRNKYYD